MERLTLWHDGYQGICHDKHCDMYTKNCQLVSARCEAVQNIIDRLAHYEDLEEQERLIKLPCKIGDTVYQLVEIDCEDCDYCDHETCNEERCPQQIIERPFSLSLLGKVFVSRDEAELRAKTWTEDETSQEG